MDRLIACVSCGRHHRPGEARCPFCGALLGHAVVSDTPRRASPLPTRGVAPWLAEACSGATSRASRRANYAIGTALAAGLLGSVACDSPQITRSPVDETTVTPADATPPGNNDASAAVPVDASATSAGDASTAITVAEADAAVPARPDAATARPAGRDAGAVIVNPNGWNGNRMHHECTRTPQGQMICPPYGCVFPGGCDDVYV